MAIMLELPLEEEQRLRQRAEIAGQDVTTYLLTGVGIRISMPQPLTNAEWESLADEAAGIVPSDVPPLSDYAVSREAMYEGRF